MDVLTEVVVRTTIFRLHLSDWIENIYLLQKLNLKNGDESSKSEFP